MIIYPIGQLLFEKKNVLRDHDSFSSAWISVSTTPAAQLHDRGITVLLQVPAIVLLSIQAFTAATWERGSEMLVQLNVNGFRLGNLKKKLWQFTFYLNRRVKFLNKTTVLRTTEHLGLCPGHNRLYPACGRM